MKELENKDEDRKIPTANCFAICVDDEVVNVLAIYDYTMEGKKKFIYKYIKEHYSNYKKVKIIDCTCFECECGDNLNDLDQKAIIENYVNLDSFDIIESDESKDEVLKNIINSDSDNATKGAEICCRMQTIYGINTITFMKNPSLIMDKFDRTLWQQAFEEIYK